MAPRKKKPATIKSGGPNKNDEAKQSLKMIQPSVADIFKVSKKRGAKVTNEGKKKRQINRFGGVTEEELAKRGLPDYIKEGLDVVFIGINPGMYAAYTGLLAKNIL